MKLPKFDKWNPVFDIGIELEFFLADGGTIYNAKKVLEDVLGFGIDQNDDNAGELKLNDTLSLRTDGTACEFHIFFNNYYLYVLDDYFKRINNIKAIDGYTKLFIPFIKTGNLINTSKFKREIAKFDSPNNVFASEKQMRNAYEAKNFVTSKKEEQKEVTIRTAGLHIHFSVSTNYQYNEVRDKLNQYIFNDPLHTDRLIQQLDNLFETLIMPTESKWSKLRREHYQKLGDYRVKNQKNGVKTFEYRQLDASLYNNVSKLIEFIQQFQMAAHEDLSEHVKNL